MKERDEERARRERDEAARREREALRDDPNPVSAAGDRHARGSQESWDRERERDRVDPRDLPRDVPAAEAAREAHEPLLGGEAGSLRQEWESVQAGFVDEPRQAVERADKLVARAAQQIADRFGRERQRLEEQWGRGGEVSTEDLRVALRRYRAFFDRLLSI